MPLRVSFHGRPVKHRRRTAEGLRLTFVNPIRGQTSVVAIVTQEVWQCYGTIEFFPRHLMPDVRALAARFEQPSFYSQTPRSQS